MGATSRLILIGVILGLAIFGLWPTYSFYRLNSEREAIADSAARARWDSLHYDDWLDARNGRIKLGLDLQGGIYITMEVDAVALLQESAERAMVDDAFEQVITETRKEVLLSDEAVLDIFLQKFDEIARPKGRSLLNYFDVGDLGTNASDEAVIEKLRRNIDDAVDQALEVVRQRIDKVGVSEATIQKQGARRIILELPGVTDEEEIRGLLETTARLEFKLVRNNQDAVTLFRAIDDIMAGTMTEEEDSKTNTAATSADTNATANADTTANRTDTSANADDTTLASGDSAARDSAPGADTNDPYAGLSQEEAARKYGKEHPFTTLFTTQFQVSEKDHQTIDYARKEFPSGEYFFYIPKENIAKLRAILRRSDIRPLIPEEFTFAFSDRPFNELEPSSPFEMFVLKADPELTGDVVTDAYPDFDPVTGKPMVIMGMNSEGADRWATITGENLKKRVAIVLDSSVYSAPTVQSKITGGSSQITGSKDAKEASLLVVILKAGALKAPVKIIEERLVGPSLGEDSIRQGVNALLAAALLVIIFMLLYYSFGGLIADMAVMMNVLITLSILASLQGTLTLPGIGALVLTIGMAVDANILIYERIREELALGKSLKTAVNLGYQRAFSAIFDSNITTFMTGAILALFGSGPVQGFAIMLMIGIAVTLFTAIFVTRAVFTLMLDRGSESISYGQPKLIQSR